MLIGFLTGIFCSLASMTLGFVVGVITSAIGTCLVIQWQSDHKRRIQAEKYGKIAGKYQGFTFKASNGRKLSTEPKSTAEITYLKDNFLKIRLVEHNGRSWQGLITMEMEQYGSLVWNYLNSTQEEYEFGFKRCIVNSPNEIYLIGEKLDGYDKEVLKRI